MKISPKQRAVLFCMFDGHCAYCGCVLPEKGWHADHVEPIYRNPKYTGWMAAKYPAGGCTFPDRDVVGNFMPSCRRCNLHKTAYSLESWRLVLEQQVRMARDYSRNYQMAERFGLVAQVETKVVFYFERLPSPPEPAKKEEAL